MRRRQRRLRQFLRHERLSVATALTEFSHHTSRGQRVATAGRVEREVNYEPRLQNPPLPQAASTVFYTFGDDEVVLAAGVRPAPLSEVRTQGKLQRPSGIGYELVQALDVPALHMGEEVDDYDFLHGLPDHPEQLIVQEIPVPSSVDHAKQPRDVEQVLNGPVLHFHDEDVALGAFLEQVTIQEFPEVQVPSSGAFLSTVSGRFLEQVVDVPVAVPLVLNQLVPQERA